VDDRRAQFVIAIGDLCTAAALASLEVDVRLSDGSSLHGVPSRPRPESGREELDDTGYANGLQIGDRVVALADVVCCGLSVPAGAGDAA
jgi:hypothetical protein